MSIFSALANSKVYNFEQAFGVKDITTPAMLKAIQEWYDLYYARKPVKGENPCQRLPVVIINKLTKTSFSEYSASTKKEGKKGEYITNVLRALEKIRKEGMQKSLIGGRCFLKPVLAENGKIVFRVIERLNYLALGQDAQGNVTDIGTGETTVIDGLYYTLLERRTVNANGFLTIENRLFCSKSREMLGVEIKLSSVEKYAHLEPVNTLPAPVWSLGLIPVETPLENCVDGSEDPVSVYAPAVGLIHQVNMNEAQIDGEFERGESRIIVSSDLMRSDEHGRQSFSDHVFLGIDESPDEIGVTIFSPALREQSFLARKKEYLRNIETTIGLKRGILSEVEAEERTAKEITSSEGDYSLTIVDFQQMWENAVREAVRVCDILGQIYGLCDNTTIDPDQDITIDFGNGILYDSEKEWANYMSMVSAGMIRPEIALAWKFGIPWEKPEDLLKIREKYMPELERLTAGDE